MNFPSISLLLIQWLLLQFIASSCNTLTPYCAFVLLYCKRMHTETEEKLKCNT